MYKRYKLKKTIELENLVKEYSSYGKVIMEEQRCNINKELDDYINQQGYIDMSQISEDWFPEVDCDVFLSHSHKDDILVTGLVGFFHKCFNLKVFVDSYVWGYCNDLLKQLDNKYCRTENSFYDYDKRNYSTAHVHMMLSTSLSSMINRAECIIFLETENSLDAKNIIENGTSSPWIYYELITTKLTQLIFPKRITPEKRSELLAFSENFKPMYRGNTSHLENLTSNCLNYVKQKNYQTKEEYLDEIYQNHSRT